MGHLGLEDADEGEDVSEDEGRGIEILRVLRGERERS